MFGIPLQSLRLNVGEGISIIRRQDFSHFKESFPLGNFIAALCFEGGYIEGTVLDDIPPARVASAIPIRDISRKQRTFPVQAPNGTIPQSIQIGEDVGRRPGHERMVVILPIRFHDDLFLSQDMSRSDSKKSTISWTIRSDAWPSSTFPIRERNRRRLDCNSS